MFKRLLLFFAMFCSLQTGWQLCRGSVIERLVIDIATVKPAAFFASKVSGTPVIAAGNSLNSSLATLNVLNGCEGLEMLFLLVAAFFAARLPWQVRVLSLIAGSLLVYALNQLRLIMLWQLWLHDRDWFGPCHTLIFPAALMLLCYAFFAIIMAQQEKAA